MSDQEQVNPESASQSGVECVRLCGNKPLSSKVKVVGWKHKLPHDSEYTFAYTKRPVYAADGTKGFAAAVLQKVRAGEFHGRVYRVPLRVTLYPKSWQASCAALSWYCQSLGLPFPSADPGSLTLERKRELQGWLDGRDQRSSLNAYLPVRVEKPKPSGGTNAVTPEEVPEAPPVPSDAVAQGPSVPPPESPIVTVGWFRSGLQRLLQYCLQLLGCCRGPARDCPAK